MEIQFTKGHGTGNDFVLIDDFENDLELTEEQIRFLCDRHFGIGSDGVIFAVRTKNSEVAHLAEEDPACEWFMDYLFS